MTKRDIVKQIVAKTGMTYRDVAMIVQYVLDAITAAMARGETIELRDFGVFKVCVRKPRIGRNPRRPQQTVQIPERKVVTFKAGKIMKELVLKS